MGMAHRGRLNVLANIVGKSYAQIFREFEGELDPNVPQGSGDVKYHVGATGKFTSRSGATIGITLAANPSHLEAVDPVVEGMARAKQDRLGDDGARPRAAGADPRRRRVRGPGRGRGDAQPLRAARLRRRRHRAHRRQQPGRVHHHARLRPLDRVRHRHRQGGAGADLPRERRRPRSGGAHDPARVRVPQRLQEGRRRRHGVLPALRPQRGRRARVHAAADVRGDRPTAVRSASSTPSSSSTAATSRSRTPSTRSKTSGPGSKPRSTRPRRSVRPPATVGRRPTPEPTPVARRPPACRRERLDQIVDALDDVPARLRAAPQAGAHPRATGARSSTTTRSTGRSPRRSRSARCCSRARRCASRARTRGGARSASGTRCSSTTGPKQEYTPLAHLGDDAGAVHDLRLRALGVRRARLRVRLLGLRPRRARVLGGAVRRLRQRRADDHRPVHRRRRGQVGPAQRPRACCSPTASRARAPSTRRPGSNASSCCAREDNIRVVYPTTAAQYFHVLRRQVHDPHAQAARRDDAEALPAHAGDRIAGRRRSRRAASSPCSTTPRRPPSVDAGRVLQRQVRARADRPARRRSARPVAIVRLEQLYPWPRDEIAAELDALPRRGGVLGAGGAGQHGRPLLRPPPHRGDGRRPPGRRGRPGREPEPRDRQLHRARRRTEGPARRARFAPLG